MVAMRDAESRTRFLGYRPEYYKLVVWTLSAMLAGIGGALYVPQVGIINPSEFAPANSIEAVIWVAVGGRGTLSGAILGAVLVNLGKTILTGAMPGAWLYRAGRSVHPGHVVPAARNRRQPAPQDARDAILPTSDEPQGIAAIDSVQADLRESGADWRARMNEPIGAPTRFSSSNGVNKTFDGFRR